jgi:P-type Ca2+ transporter type 2C
MVLSEIEVKNLKGLSASEVEASRKRDGYNELPAARKKGIWGIVLGVLTEPMFLLLVSCGLIYLFTGDVGEAAMLLGFVFVIMGITVYQESKTENALEALRDLSSPRALVIRDGERLRIPGREVVRDDLIVVQEGDRIPADAVLLWGVNLSCDESLLTGESVPVRKLPIDDDGSVSRRPGGDDLPFLFSGSLVSQGQGVARVLSIGADTEMGHIGTALKGIETENTSLQKETGRLVRIVFIVAIILCAVVIVVYGLTRRDWLGGLLAGITLAMAMIPEEFPVVLTIFLALGAWRISKKQVLTRRVAAVETLGSATVLCTDKTGTLTQNRMSIRRLASVSGDTVDLVDLADRPLPEDFHEVVEYAILASKKDPFDPMEKALRELGVVELATTEHLHDSWNMTAEYPLSRELLALSHVWSDPDGKGYIIAAKGAPEAVADLCHLGAVERSVIKSGTEAMAKAGLRVLGVAKSSYRREGLPTSQHDFDFSFVGLVGLEDPIRESVPAAIRECYGAGIRVIMITGDYPSTASTIASRIGLKDPDRVITGPELEAMKPEDLALRIRETNIFARVVPEQKLRIVEALKANGEVVAMTGDGVNDAPALKSAHIGVAMGERGTDVAREASAIVLLKDDFGSIVQAVRIGRRIFDNLKKAMAYIIGVHIPIAGITLLPVLFKWPIVLHPVHIVFLELIIDPACSVVFEREEEEGDIMTRPPRNPAEPLFSARMLSLSVLQGVFALFAVAFVFRGALVMGQSETEARALAFVTLIVSNLSLILSNRSWTESVLASFKKRNAALNWVLACAVVFLVLVVYVPGLKSLFLFSSMELLDWAVAVGAGLLSVLWFELMKLFSKSGTHGKASNRRKEK